MSKKSFFMVVCLVIGCLLYVGGCSDEPEGPATEGINNTGSYLKINFEELDPYIDAVNDWCVDENAYEPDRHYLGDLSFENVPLTDDLDNVSTLHVISYSVEYNSSDPGAAPISDERHVAFSLHLAPEDSADVEGMLIISSAKVNEFLNNGGNPALDPTYQARFTFYGVNDFNESFSAVWSCWLVFSNLNTCDLIP